MADYSKTLIYKIQNIDDETLLYVGSTVAFRSRKSGHKSATNNPTNKKYHRKVYEMIRANGGWKMFNMIVIKEFPCKNKQEALTEEDRIMREMKANMNSKKAYNSCEEKLANSKVYRYENRDKLNEKRKVYIEENKDTINEKHKTWRDKNRDKLKTYRDKNRDKINENQKAHRDKNKDAINEQQRAKYQANKLKINMTTQ